jgi:hypothetical protein
LFISEDDSVKEAAVGEGDHMKDKSCYNVKYCLLLGVDLKSGGIDTLDWLLRQNSQSSM